VPIDLKSLIVQELDRMVQRLVDIAPKERRSEATQIGNDIRSLLLESAKLPHAGADERYASCQYPIDAIRLLLADVDRPSTWEEIIDGVIAKGFRPGKEARTRGDIKKSLRMYLQGEARHKKEIKQIDDMVGLPEWDDARFKPRR